MKLKEGSLRLYAVTDRSWAPDTAGLLKQVEEAIAGGATMVQLREKHLGDDAFLEEAKQFVALCRRCGVLSIINDNAEIAVKSGADGVHVGQDDLAAAEARRKLGPDKIVGVSAHNVAEALAAVRDGADYLGSGAVFGSTTKTNVHTLPHETLQDICRAVDIPVVAIGGITKDNLPQLAGTGIDGVALVSAIFAAPDIEAECRALRALTLQTIRA